MAEKLEKLSQEDQEKIKRWIDKHGLNVCSKCKKDKYTLMDELIKVPSVSDKVYYPAFLTVCLTCGYLSSYAATLVLLDALSKYGIELISKSEREESNE